LSASERKWSELESSVFSAAAVMRSTDIAAKMVMVSHLQSLAEDLQRALEREDEGDEEDAARLPNGTTLRDFQPVGKGAR
jgi:hypothetical protein